MRRIILTTAMVLITASAVFISCTGDSKTADSVTKEQPGLVMDSAQMVARGAYLVSILGCDDCHSPKRMGAHGPELIPELRLSGFPHDGQSPPLNTGEVKKGWVLFLPDLTSSVGPWGRTFAANLTSDATGIGNWSYENFVNAIRKGKYRGLDQGRDMLPPMPWLNYRNMNEEDLQSVFAYLKTVAPVKNIVPDAIPPAELK